MIQKEEKMNRSRKIVIMAHCILNANAKVTPLATYPGVLEGVVKPFIENGTGIVQLPCPESTFLGMNRWGMSKDQYDHPAYRAHCRNLLIPYIHQIIAFKKAGYTFEGAVGINGSPSCGISVTPTGLEGGVPGPGDTPFEAVRYINESGVFMDAFKALLSREKIRMTFFAIDEKNPSILKEV